MIEEPRGAVTRRRLLDAARAELVEGGIAGATSRAITSRAGANLAAVTYHFGSKDALIAEAAIGLARQLLEPIRALLADASLDPAVRLDQAAGSLLEALDNIGPQGGALFAAVIEAARLPHVADLLAGLASEFRADIALHTEQERGAGLLPEWVDGPAMAALLIAVMQGVLVQLLIDPSGPSPSRIAEQLLHLFDAARLASP